MKATGRCFYNSFHLFLKFNSMKAFNGELLLVHGIVWHVKSGYHIHGWVESNCFCFDFINDQVRAIEKTKYYSAGKIKTGKGEIQKYKIDQAILKAVHAGNYYFSKLPCKQ